MWSGGGGGGRVPCLEVDKGSSSRSVWAGAVELGGRRQT